MCIKQPIRILQVIGIPIGGVEVVIMNYYRHINRDKIQFDFVFHNDMESVNVDEIKALGGKIYQVTPYNQNPIKFMSEIYHIIKAGNYKVIHNNMNTLAWFGLLPAWLANVPIRILHNHSTSIPSETKRNLLKAVFKPIARLFANQYWACSKLAAKWMYGEHYDKSVQVINNAIDLKKFAFNQIKRDQLREKYNLEDKFVIGHIGRFMYQKNHVFLVHMFVQLLKDIPNAVLVLVGEGPLRMEIEQVVEKLHIQNSVKFLGQCKDVQDLYSVMDIFVLPSYYEGLPVVSVEAQANSLPLLMSKYVTEEAILVPSKTKCLPIDSYNIWVSAIKEVLKNTERNTPVYTIMRNAGFDIRLEVEKLEKLYDECF